MGSCHLGNRDATETFQFSVRSWVLGPDVHQNTSLGFLMFLLMEMVVVQCYFWSGSFLSVSSAKFIVEI